MDFNNIFIQRDYANNLVSRLDKPTIISQSPFKAIFRCEVCGDSKDNKSKKRGYLLEKGDSIVYFCHNCDHSMSLLRHLKEYHIDLYQPMLADLFRDSRETVQRTEPVKKEEPRRETSVYLKGLTDIFDLPRNHPCIQYLVTRKIPHLERGQMFYTERFYQYANNIVANKFSYGLEKSSDHGRLVMLLKRPDSTIFGVVARTISHHDIKYFSVKFEEHNKLYNLDRITPNKYLFVVESPIDTFFMTNACALAGTDGDISEIVSTRSDYTLVLDNQPRNPQVVNKYLKYIKLGYRVCIWPDGMEGGKDINDLYKSGYTIEEIESIIKTNTYEGRQAEWEFSKWKKV